MYSLNFFLIISLFSSVIQMAYLPPQPWSTLTPTSTFPAAIINYSRTFGLIVEPISLIKRNLLCQTLNGEMRPTTTTNEYVIPVTQINDGQIGCPTRMTTPVLQIKDGQIQVRTKTYTNQDIHIKEDDVIAIINAQIIDTCKMDDMLQLYLTEGVLTDEKHRIGSIVANRQFQFDGPPPQAGAIYAGGWCITPEGDLALGDQDEFYQCLSGSFYNIYERSIAPQCSPIHLKVTNLVVC